MGKICQSKFFNPKISSQNITEKLEFFAKNIPDICLSNFSTNILPKRHFRPKIMS